MITCQVLQAGQFGQHCQAGAGNLGILLVSTAAAQLQPGEPAAGCQLRRRCCQAAGVEGQRLQGGRPVGQLSCHVN